MKKSIKVIRSANQTVVIYREVPKEKAAQPVLRQKPVPVYLYGERIHYIMPSGRMIPVRRGWMWRIMKFMRPRAAFAL